MSANYSCVNLEDNSHILANFIYLIYIFWNVIHAVFSSLKFKVRYKYNYFITDVPNCNSGNLGGQMHIKNGCISNKHALHMENQLWGYEWLKKQKQHLHQPNQTKPKKKFAYISVSREKYKDVWQIQVKKTLDEINLKYWGKKSTCSWK